MLAKFWRLRMKWDADQTLTYDSGGSGYRCLRIPNP